MNITKFFVSILLIALLSFAACLYLPWWTIAVVALIVTALIHQSPVRAFLCGFIALFTLWTILASSISINNDHILAGKISTLILGMESSLLLILLTGLIAGLVGGLGALAGSFLTKQKVSDDRYTQNSKAI